MIVICTRKSIVSYTGKPSFLYKKMIVLFLMSKSVAVELALQYLRTIGWQEKSEEIKVCLDGVET